MYGDSRLRVLRVLAVESKRVQSTFDIRLVARVAKMVSNLTLYCFWYMIHSLVFFSQDNGSVQLEIPIFGQLLSVWGYWEPTDSRTEVRQSSYLDFILLIPVRHKVKLTKDRIFILECKRTIAKFHKIFYLMLY